MTDTDIFRKTRIGNGFVKEDVESYVRKLKAQVESLRQKLKEIMSAQYYETFMNKFDINEILADDYLEKNVRVKRLGGGYRKEDVMIYLDRINAIITIFTQQIESASKPVKNNGFLR